MRQKWYTKFCFINFTFLRCQLYDGPNMLWTYCSNRNCSPQDLYTMTFLEQWSTVVARNITTAPQQSGAVRRTRAHSRDKILGSFFPSDQVCLPNKHIFTLNLNFWIFFKIGSSVIKQSRMAVIVDFDYFELSVSFIAGLKLQFS